MSPRYTIDLFMNYRWRRHRKAAHESLNKVVSNGLKDYQIEEALVLARNSLQYAAGWDKHLRSAAAGMMLRCLYDDSPVCHFRTRSSWLVWSHPNRRLLASTLLVSARSTNSPQGHLAPLSPGHFGYVSRIQLLLD